MTAVRGRRQPTVKVAVIASLAMSLIASATVTAHQPLVGAQMKYAVNTALTYHFDGSYAAWFTGAVNTALQTGWDSPSYNNSKGPTFTYSATGSGRITYLSAPPYTGTGLPAQCQFSTWLGCANGGGTSTWRIWIHTEGTYDYCESGGLVDGCFTVVRAMLHEAMHITLGHSDASQSASGNTAADSNAAGNNQDVSYDNAWWNSSNPRRCDEAALQLRYGLKTVSSGRFADCYDHTLGHGAQGLDTTITATTTSGTQCSGDPVTASGRVAVLTTTNYDKLSGVVVAGRTLRFDRKVGSGAWVNNWSSVVTTAATGTNWTKVITESPGFTQTYSYRAHFDGEVDKLDPITSITWSITFLQPCPPP